MSLRLDYFLVLYSFVSVNLQFAMNLLDSHLRLLVKYSFVLLYFLNSHSLKTIRLLLLMNHRILPAFCVLISSSHSLFDFLQCHLLVLLFQHEWFVSFSEAFLLEK